MDATLMFYLWEIAFLFLTSLFSAPVFAKRFCAVFEQKRSREPYTIQQERTPDTPYTNVNTNFQRCN